MKIGERLEEQKIKVLSIYFWKKLNETNKSILQDAYKTHRSNSICESLILVKKMLDIMNKNVPMYAGLTQEERNRIVDKWWIEGKFHR